MNNHFTITAVVAILSCTTSCATDETQQKAMVQVGFENVKIQDAFWSPRLENNVLHTIPVCLDQIENQTGRIRNFENAARHQGQHSGKFYDDSDAYKAVEGVAYSLMNHPDAELEKHMDEWIDKFAAAQLEDGYLNTYYTLTGLENRWTDMDKHEMYCAGHLLEGAIAYYKATGKDKLLRVAIRMADHMMQTFMLAGRHWVPGHEEIELALCKLYALNGEKKYLDFAYWLLEQRGRGYSNLDQSYGLIHYQDVVPVRELREIHGHAVRAMYLFCGMADVASYISDTDYMEALDSLWEDVINRRMYITGGIGVAYQTEGFSVPYDLPNYEAYCETCASIGMVLWNHRMNEWKGDAKYANVLERSLYNGVLAGISLQGDRFFYVNPLASYGNHHRQAWYGTACCPSNLCRFIPSIGNYIYGTSLEALWINLYIGSEATCKVGSQEVKIKMDTEMPWEGKSRLTFQSDMDGQLRLRIPDWSENFQITVNSKAVDYQIERGYAVVERHWKDGDVVDVTTLMEVKVVAADPRVKADEGQRAIQRGPIVYCAEQIDNPNTFFDIAINEKTEWQIWHSDILNGIKELTGSESGQTIVNLIPYYAWDNREACEMKVWLPWGKYGTISGVAPELADNGFYQVANCENLVWIREKINRGNTDIKVALIQDIDLSDYSKFMLAEDRTKPYTGVFDGQGHTIKLAINVNYTGKYSGALFRYAKDATFKNLHLTGSVTTCGTTPASLVSVIYGTSTITNVTSDCNIFTNADDACMGGLVGCAGDNGVDAPKMNLIINNCAFTGSMTHTGDIRQNHGGNLVGWKGNVSTAVTINNSYAAPKSISHSSSFCTFVRFWVDKDNGKINVNNSYYLNNIRDYVARQGGIRKTAEEFANGSVCYLLNRNQNETVWYQTIGVDPYPVLDATHGVVILNEDGSYGNTTGIENVQAFKGSNVQDPVVCDLSGRKISTDKLSKGIYIINRKKFFVM